MLKRFSATNPSSRTLQKAQIEMAGLASGLLMLVLAVPGDMPSAAAEKDAIEAVQAKIKTCITLIEMDKIETLIGELVSPAELIELAKVESLETMARKFRDGKMFKDSFMAVLKIVQSQKPNIIDLKTGHVGYDLSKYEGIPKGLPGEMVFQKVDKSWYMLPGPRPKTKE